SGMVSPVWAASWSLPMPLIAVLEAEDVAQLVSDDREQDPVPIGRAVRGGRELVVLSRGGVDASAVPLLGLDLKEPAPVRGGDLQASVGKEVPPLPGEGQDAEDGTLGRRIPSDRADVERAAQVGEPGDHQLVELAGVAAAEFDIENTGGRLGVVAVDGEGPG